MAKEIKTQIVINTSSEKVWSILMDFKNYPNWNPFIKSIHGNAIEGHTIIAHIVPPDTKGMTLKPKVKIVTENKEFRWKGHLLFGGLFDGEHKFELVDNGDGTTTFIHSEKFGGILVPMLTKMLDDNTVRGFEAMNLKLKEVAEK